jgi:hypothetical protein
MAEATFKARPPSQGALADPSSVGAFVPNHLKVIAALRTAHDVSTERHATVSDRCGDLFGHIRKTTARLRYAESMLHKRDEQLRELTQKRRVESEAATERVLRAETRAHEAEVQGRLAAAEWQKRALAAEEKVQEIEGWLAKMQNSFGVDLD